MFGCSLPNQSRETFAGYTNTIIIKALVFNTLYYCPSVWSNTSKKNINKLQSVQNFAARLVTNTRMFDHITPVLSALNWLPVNSTLNLKDAVMTFKCLKGLAPTYLSEKFKQRSQLHNCNTRSKDTLQTPFHHSASGQRIYTGVKNWNDLSDTIKCIDSVNRFKLAYKRILNKL